MILRKFNSRVHVEGRCSIEGCSEPATCFLQNRGICSEHYFKELRFQRELRRFKLQAMNQ